MCVHCDPGPEPPGRTTISVSMFVCVSIYRYPTFHTTCDSVNTSCLGLDACGCQHMLHINQAGHLGGRGKATKVGEALDPIAAPVAKSGYLVKGGGGQVRNHGQQARAAASISLSRQPGCSPWRVVVNPARGRPAAAAAPISPPCHRCHVPRDGGLLPAKTFHEARGQKVLGAVLAEGGMGLRSREGERPAGSQGV